MRAAVEGLRTGLLATKFSKNPPTSLHNMYDKLEECYRSEEDYIHRIEKQIKQSQKRKEWDDTEASKPPNKKQQKQYVNEIDQPQGDKFH